MSTLANSTAGAWDGMSSCAPCAPDYGGQVDTVRQLLVEQRYPSHAPPFSGVPKPDPEPRPALMDVAYTIRSFGQWTRHHFTGAHEIIVRPLAPSQLGQQDPLQEQARIFRGRACTWDTVTIGKP